MSCGGVTIAVAFQEVYNRVCVPRWLFGGMWLPQNLCSDSARVGAQYEAVSSAADKTCHSDLLYSAAV
jgi:hypothetical protein